MQNPNQSTQIVITIEAMNTTISGLARNRDGLQAQINNNPGKKATHAQAFHLQNLNYLIVFYQDILNILKKSSIDELNNIYTRINSVHLTQLHTHMATYVQQKKLSASSEEGLQLQKVYKNARDIALASYDKASKDLLKKQEATKVVLGELEKLQRDLNQALSKPYPIDLSEKGEASQLLSIARQILKENQFKGHDEIKVNSVLDHLIKSYELYNFIYEINTTLLYLQSPTAQVTRGKLVDIVKNVKEQYDKLTEEFKSKEISMVVDGKMQQISLHNLYQQFNLYMLAELKKLPKFDNQARPIVTAPVNLRSAMQQQHKMSSPDNKARPIVSAPLNLRSAMQQHKVSTQREKKMDQPHLSNEKPHSSIRVQPQQQVTLEENTGSYLDGFMQSVKSGVEMLAKFTSDEMQETKQPSKKDEKIRVPPQQLATVKELISIGQQMAELRQSMQSKIFFNQDDIAKAAQLYNQFNRLYRGLERTIPQHLNHPYFIEFVTIARNIDDYFKVHRVLTEIPQNQYAEYFSVYMRVLKAMQSVDGRLDVSDVVLVNDIIKNMPQLYDRIANKTPELIAQYQNEYPVLLQAVLQKNSDKSTLSTSELLQQAGDVAAKAGSTIGSVLGSVSSYIPSFISTASSTLTGSIEQKSLFPSLVLGINIFKNSEQLKADEQQQLITAGMSRRNDVLKQLNAETILLSNIKGNMSAQEWEIYKNIHTSRIFLLNSTPETLESNFQQVLTNIKTLEAYLRIINPNADLPEIIKKSFVQQSKQIEREYLIAAACLGQKIVMNSREESQTSSNQDAQQENRQRKEISVFNAMRKKWQLFEQMEKREAELETQKSELMAQKIAIPPSATMNEDFSKLDQELSYLDKRLEIIQKRKELFAKVRDIESSNSERPNRLRELNQEWAKLQLMTNEFNTWLNKTTMTIAEKEKIMQEITHYNAICRSTALACFGIVDAALIKEKKFEPIKTKVNQIKPEEKNTTTSSTHKSTAETQTGSPQTSNSWSAYFNDMVESSTNFVKSYGLLTETTATEIDKTSIPQTNATQAKEQVQNSEKMAEEFFNSYRLLAQKINAYRYREFNKDEKFKDIKDLLAKLQLQYREIIKVNQQSQVAKAIEVLFAKMGDNREDDTIKEILHVLGQPTFEKMLAQAEHGIKKTQFEYSDREMGKMLTRLADMNTVFTVDKSARALSQKYEFAKELVAAMKEIIVPLSTEVITFIPSPPDSPKTLHDKFADAEKMLVTMKSILDKKQQETAQTRREEGSTLIEKQAVHRKNSQAIMLLTNIENVISNRDEFLSQLVKNNVHLNMREFMQENETQKIQYQRELAQYRASFNQLNAAWIKEQSTNKKLSSMDIAVYSGQLQEIRYSLERAEELVADNQFRNSHEFDELKRDHKRVGVPSTIVQRAQERQETDRKLDLKEEKRDHTQDSRRRAITINKQSRK